MAKSYTIPNYSALTIYPNDESYRYAYKYIIAIQYPEILNELIARLKIWRTHELSLKYLAKSLKPDSIQPLNDGTPVNRANYNAVKTNTYNLIDKVCKTYEKLSYYGPAKKSTNSTTYIDSNLPLSTASQRNINMDLLNIIDGVTNILKTYGYQILENSYKTDKYQKKTGKIQYGYNPAEYNDESYSVTLTKLFNIGDDNLKQTISQTQYWVMYDREAAFTALSLIMNEYPIFPQLIYNLPTITYPTNTVQVYQMVLDNGINELLSTDSIKYTTLKTTNITDITTITNNKKWKFSITDNIAAKNTDYIINKSNTYHWTITHDNYDTPLANIHEIFKIKNSSTKTTTVYTLHKITSGQNAGKYKEVTWMENGVEYSTNIVADSNTFEIPTGRYNNGTYSIVDNKVYKGTSSNASGSIEYVFNLYGQDFTVTFTDNIPSKITFSYIAPRALSDLSSSTHFKMLYISKDHILEVIPDMLDNQLTPDTTEKEHPLAQITNIDSTSID